MLKKSIKLFVFMLIGVILLFGCNNNSTDGGNDQPGGNGQEQPGGNTETTLLATPENFVISGTIASWEAVDGATKYRLEFIKDGSSMKRTVNETSIDLNSLNLPVGTYKVNVQAIGDGTNDSKYTESSLTYEQKRLDIVNELANQDILDSLYVKWNGRTLYNESLNVNMLYHSASGFEVKFIGSSVTARLYATNYNNPSQKPYVVIVLDDDFDNMVRIALEAKYTDLELVKDITDGKEHKVTLYKSTESIDSHVGVESIKTDGEFIQGIDIKERKIEFIAASSSTGYGNLASSANEGKNTTNSDCMQGFAAITARSFDADFQIISASGWGVLNSAYTNPGENIANAYKYYDFRGEAKDIPYSFGLFTPDVIVVNLGTNDYSWAGKASTEAERLERLAAFEKQYSSFIEYLHGLYPEAHIVLFHGLMNENVAIANLTQKIYEELLPTVGDENISIIKVSGDAQGSAYHPSVASHKKVADLLIAHIKENVGW